MGPSNLTMSSSSNVKVFNLPKLQEDGSNWVTYKERIINNLTSKGLIRHITGTVKKPTTLLESNGIYFHPRNLQPLTDMEVDAHKLLMNTYDQKQAQVKEIIYETVSKSVFLKIKDKNSAENIWKKLVSIHEAKGTMTYTDTLTKLSMLRYAEGKSMHAHTYLFYERAEGTSQQDGITHQR